MFDTAHSRNGFKEIDSWLTLPGASQTEI